MSEGAVRAWVPWDPDEGLSTAGGLAIRWAEELSRRVGQRGLFGHCAEGRALPGGDPDLRPASCSHDASRS